MAADTSSWCAWSKDTRTAESARRKGEHQARRTCTSDYLCGNTNLIDLDVVKVWKYLCEKHSDKALNARKNWKILTNFAKLNDNVKAEIVKFSDTNQGTSLIDFCNDLQSTNGLTSFVNDVDNFDFVKDFLGYKQNPLYTDTEYELMREELAYVETDYSNAIFEKVKFWHDHAVTTSNRKGKFEEGKQFENWVTIHLGSNQSLTYQSVKTAFLADGWNLDDYSIYTQVYFCINNSATCTGKKDYFIADFVFVKTVYNPIFQKDELDIKIGDTKLSSGTKFTKNQNLSKLQNTLYIKTTNPVKIKGVQIDLFNKPNSFTNSKIIYKIYSGGTSTTYGGVIK